MAGYAGPRNRAEALIGVAECKVLGPGVGVGVAVGRLVFKTAFQISGYNPHA